jgi:hypothetical protein
MLIWCMLVFLNCGVETSCNLWLSTVFMTVPVLKSLEMLIGFKCLGLQFWFFASLFLAMYIYCYKQIVQFS